MCYSSKWVGLVKRWWCMWAGLVARKSDDLYLWSTKIIMHHTSKINEKAIIIVTSVLDSLIIMNKCITIELLVLIFPNY